VSSSVQIEVATPLIFVREREALSRDVVLVPIFLFDLGLNLFSVADFLDDLRL